MNILVTQPRRIACLALASRLAKILNEEVGETVGYRVGGDVRCTPCSTLRKGAMEWERASV